MFFLRHECSTKEAPIDSTVLFHQKANTKPNRLTPVYSWQTIVSWDRARSRFYREWGGVGKKFSPSCTWWWRGKNLHFTIGAIYKNSTHTVRGRKKHPTKEQFWEPPKMASTIRSCRRQKKHKRQLTERHFSRRLLSVVLGLAFASFSLGRWRAAEEDVVATSVTEMETASFQYYIVQ